MKYTLYVVFLSLLATVLFGTKNISYRAEYQPRKVRSEVRLVTVTAYNLVSSQTDATPCETVLGPSIDICKLAKEVPLCATWLYPPRTWLKVGNRECYVVDRTARKYKERIDLVLPSYHEAVTFGVQTLLVEVISK